MAASKGYKDAVCKFAKICKYDSYLLQLYKDELIHDFKLAIENGSKEAMYDYGKLLYKGTIENENTDKACYYFKNAADFGHVKAMSQLHNERCCYLL